MFAFSLLVMAGLPPTAGFFAKTYVWTTLLQTAGTQTADWWLYFGLVMVGVIVSVVSTYYYLRICKQIYFDVPANEQASLYLMDPADFSLSQLFA